MNIRPRINRWTKARRDLNFDVSIKSSLVQPHFVVDGEGIDEPISSMPGINRQSVVLNDVKLATKGDGTPRNVHVNDAKVPRRMVVDAMFRNQDFMPRTDQFPLIQNPLMVDENLKRQRSHFGPMKKQPLNLGFDVIRSNINTDITIAENGGRYEE